MERRSKNNLSLLALRRHYTQPYALYDALRKQDPLYYDAHSQSWITATHDVITAILDDERFISHVGVEVGRATSPHLASVGRQMLFMNGETHRRAQNIMLKPLSRMTKELAGEMRQFVRSLLQAACEKGEMDVVTQFSAPLSLFTIAHVMDIPYKDLTELANLERWSDTFGDVTSGFSQGDTSDIQKYEEYFRALIQERKRHPGQDLLSVLIQAEDIFPSEEDLIANCMMIFGAGRITTKKALGNGISLLMQGWEQYSSEYPVHPRFSRFLSEEMLRMTTPTRYLIREAREDLTYISPTQSHHHIHRGQRILLFLEGANYDPAVFTEPETYNPQRQPNRHLAFGYGPHQCPGAALARVEIQIALEEFLALAIPRARPEACPIWNANPNLGGFVSNPVMLERMVAHA